MIDAVTDSFTDEIRAVPASGKVAGTHKQMLGLTFRLVVCCAVVGFAVCVGLGWVGHRVYKSQKYALKAMREAVEASTAPGEAVVVDDRLLAWALRRGSDGVLKDSVWTVSESVSAASLRERLAKMNRREIVVMATPNDELVRSLDAAGFTVAQEVGWVSWDVTGKGWALFGRGRKRIYFAVAPVGR